MIVRLALFVLMALGLAGFGTVAWLSTRPPPLVVAAAAQPAPPAPPAKISLLATARLLLPGVLLKPEDLVAHEMLQSEAPADGWPDTPRARQDLLGAMVRQQLLAGEPIVPSEVMRPGEHGFLAAVLAPNTRAVTVGVDAISGSAGLIWPGDRIDLILTQSIGTDTQPLARRVAGETVLADVRVIAIDQQLMQGATTDGPDSKQARTVTLEVTKGQAERVTVAGKLGQLSLAVRSAERSPSAETSPLMPAPAAGVIWAGDVSPALLQSRVDQTGPVVLRIYHGAADAKEFKF